MNQSVWVVMLVAWATSSLVLGQRKLPSQEKDGGGFGAVPSPVARWDFEQNGDDSIHGIHGQLIGGARVETGLLLLETEGAYLKTEPLPFSLVEKTLVAEVCLANLDQRGGGLVTVESLNGITFDSMVFGEDRPRVWCNGSEHGIRFRGAEGEPETATPDQPIWMAMAYRKNGEICLFKNGTYYRPPIRTETPVQKFKKKKSEILMGKRHEGGGNPYLRCRIDFVEIYDRALTEEQISVLYRRRVKESGSGFVQASGDFPSRLLLIPHEPFSDELLRRAESGESQAQVDLGYAYYFGKGVPQNYEQAVLWYEKSAAQKNANAQNNLGGCYLSGKGIPADPAKGVALYRSAAEQGFAVAQENLALSYCRGQGIEKNTTEAFAWHLKAARQGWQPSFARVANHYEKGIGVQTDVAEGRRWHSLAERTVKEWEQSSLANDWKKDSEKMLMTARTIQPGNPTNLPVARRRILPVPARVPAVHSSPVGNSNPE